MWYAAAFQEKLPIAGGHFNFLPSWWYENYGIEHDRVVLDPNYRVKAWMAMEKAMHDRFGEARLGNPDPRPCAPPANWGNALIPAVAGCDVVLTKDQYPANRHLDEERIGGLSPPEQIENIYPYSETIRQAGYLNRKYGTDVKPTFGIRGELNDSLLIRGSEHLGDLIVDTRRARHLMDYCHQLYLRQMEWDHGVAPGGAVMIFHCANIMIGPRTYSEAILDYDVDTRRKVSELGMVFHIHNCGRAHEYIESYRKLGPVESLDIGTDSDLRQVMEAFPDSKVSYIINARWLKSAALSEIADGMKAIFERASGHLNRLFFNVADIESGTPDENLCQFYQCCRTAA